MPVQYFPRPPFLAALVSLALLLPMGDATAQGNFDARELAAIRINAIDLLANEPNLPLPVRQRRDALRTYYEENGGDLLWLGSDRVVQLIDWLSSADDDGLDPDAYPSDQLARLAEALDSTDERGRAIVELHFSAAFLEYASDLKVGRFLPRKVDPGFFLQSRTIDQVAALEGLAAADKLDRFFESWQPAGRDYAALRAALADYRALAEHSGWPTVPMGETLKPGMSDPRVPALRARLSFTDGADPEAPPDGELIYDDALVEAVKMFQARHGLDVDGLAGRATIVALNVPVEERIQEMVIAMERWRWMPDDLGEQHVMVNIAGFDLKLVRDGEIEDRMAVVVGKPYHRTPVFSNAIKYLEFNPYWNVPPSIALNEELPKLRRNPGARAAAGFEAVSGDRVIPLTAINWNQYGPGNFPFRLRQRPGTNNALGRVKFMFPNEHNVYLHDTPSRSLFSQSERAFSHGCVRLSRPLDLAGEVLAAGAVAGWDRSRIDAVVASADRTVVNLETPLPVHITYLTAWVDDGIPNFRGDIYEHDEKLVAALDGKSLAW